jgi:hypothetical protein
MYVLIDVVRKLNVSVADPGYIESKIWKVSLFWILYYYYDAKFGLIEGNNEKWTNELFTF